jgi:DNA-binding beta-propeller fold protein YncE
VPGAPGALSAATDRLYVVLGDSRSVATFDLSGTRLALWRGNAFGIDAPIDVDVGPDGRVYIADATARGVMVVTPSGELVDAARPQIDGADVTPVSVAADSAGNLFVQTEVYLIRMRAGSAIAEPIDNPGGRDVALGPGSGLVTAVNDPRLGFSGVRHFPDRRAVRPQFEAWGNPFAEMGTLDRLRRVSANTDDRVFVLDAWPRLQTWRAGAPTHQFPTSPLTDVAGGLRGSVFGITGHALHYWAENGESLWTWRPPSTDPIRENPYGWLTALDGHDGNVAVLDMADQRVHVLDYSGNPLAEWSLAGPADFVSVADLGLAGPTLYLLSRSKRVVEARSADTGRLQAAFPIQGSPIRLDVGADGSVFVLVREGWIFKLSPAGEALAAWDATGPGSPRDISAGANGAVVAAYESALAVYEPDPAGGPQSPPQFEVRCRLSAAKTALPAEVDVGASVEVKLTVDGECPLADGRSDIVLAVDTSGSMSGPKMAAARDAALSFVGGLDYSLNRIALITFSTEVELVQSLTANPRNLIRAIPGLGDDAGTNMLGAMSLALSELNGPRSRPEARDVVIVLTDGRPSGGYG